MNQHLQARVPKTVCRGRSNTPAWMTGQTKRNWLSPRSGPGRGGELDVTKKNHRRHQIKVRHHQKSLDVTKNTAKDHPYKIGDF